MDITVYLAICRAAQELERARYQQEIVRLRYDIIGVHVQSAVAQFDELMRRQQLDPSKPHRFDDATLTIEPVESPSV